jgi:hypothetical protein
MMLALVLVLDLIFVALTEFLVEKKKVGAGEEEGGWGGQRSTKLLGTRPMQQPSGWSRSWLRLLLTRIACPSIERGMVLCVA